MGEKESIPIRWDYFFLFSYLYILMGALSGILGTMPYIYKDLPNIDTMSLFNSTNLPFSLKFLIGIDSNIKLPSWKNSVSSNTASEKLGSSQV